MRKRLLFCGKTRYTEGEVREVKEWQIRLLILLPFVAAAVWLLAKSL